MLKIGIAVAAVFGGVLSCSAAATAPAAGKMLSEPTLGFQIRLPPEWTQAQLDTSTPHIGMRAPQKSANCMVSAAENASTKGMTQAQVEKGFDKPLPPRFWLTRMFNGMADAKIQKVEARRHPSGTFLHMAVATATDGGVPLTHVSGIWAAPGTNYVIVCSAGGPKRAQRLADIMGVIESFQLNTSQKPN